MTPKSECPPVPDMCVACRGSDSIGWYLEQVVCNQGTEQWFVSDVDRLLEMADWLRRANGLPRQSDLDATQTVHSENTE